MHVLLVYPNKTHLDGRTDAFGYADFELHAKLPKDGAVRCSGVPRVRPSRGHQGDWPLEVQLRPTSNGGSLIIANRTGHLPGIRGRLNPTLDSFDRTYLYADNVAINEGMQQPLHFSLDAPVRLTDSLGAARHRVVSGNGGSFVRV